MRQPTIFRITDKSIHGSALRKGDHCTPKMATYWKSQPKKFCDFCKCWITDNKASVDFHERGKKHQENVQRRIDEVRKKSTEKAKIQEEYEDDVKKMEKAALEAFKKDLANNPELAAEYSAKLQAAKKSKESNDSLQDGKDDDEKDSTNTSEIVWHEAKAPEGYSYYWNIKTNESVWEPPEKYLSIEEQKKLEEKKTSQSKKEEKTKKKPKKENVKEAHSASNVDEKELLSMNLGPQPREAVKHVYGQWVTVSNTPEEPEKPEEPPEPLPVECIPLPGDVSQENSEQLSVKDKQIDKPKSRFKEKRITTLGDSTGESVGFKKRKIAGNRSVRQRFDDD